MAFLACPGFTQRPIGPPGEAHCSICAAYEAPEKGYQPKILWTGDEAASEESRDSIYVFRVGTVLDDNGKPEAGFYGKMYRSPRAAMVYGEVDDRIQVVSEELVFEYYLNTKGTSNLEFDGVNILFENSGKEPWPF